ncbi:MAG: hypothetical protein OXR84_00280 [Magnetovibrio sp.]|nr:hypothetical protein [Magnetovibrio sp.]
MTANGEAQRDLGDIVDDGDGKVLAVLGESFVGAWNINGRIKGGGGNGGEPARSPPGQPP